MQNEFEMIVCIVNNGFSEEVMNCVREVGAKGGTIVHAKGTMDEKIQELYQITFVPEKDMIIIVVDSEIKDNVLQAIYDNCGLNTPAKAVAFSIPVTNAVGIKK